MDETTFYSGRHQDGTLVVQAECSKCAAAARKAEALEAENKRLLDIVSSGYPRLLGIDMGGTAIVRLTEATDVHECTLVEGRKLTDQIDKAKKELDSLPEWQKAAIRAEARAHVSARAVERAYEGEG